MKKPFRLLPMFLLFLPLAALQAGTQDSPATAPPHVVEMVARKFAFIPSEIHVKAGERVQIKLSTADRAHGLRLSLYPEGGNEAGPPGLVFEQPQDDAKVEKKRDRVIEFLAVRLGTYDFQCSVQCSMGHGHDRMTGKLIVEE